MKANPLHGVPDSRTAEALEAGVAVSGLVIAPFFCLQGQTSGVHLAATDAERHEGCGAGNGVRLCGRNKALEGEPQERDRHETGPAGVGRSKASGGCENLKAQRARTWEPWQLVAAPRRENAEGDGTPREDLVESAFAARDQDSRYEKTLKEAQV
jgi:hypothetical protein